jgi:hypothetical protein
VLQARSVRSVMAAAMGSTSVRRDAHAFCVDTCDGIPAMGYLRWDTPLRYAIGVVLKLTLHVKKSPQTDFVYYRRPSGIAYPNCLALLFLTLGYFVDIG